MYETATKLCHRFNITQFVTNFFISNFTSFGQFCRNQSNFSPKSKQFQFNPNMSTFHRANTVRPQYRIKHVPSNLFLTIHHFGDAKSVKSGSGTTLRLDTEHNDWKQIWEIENRTHIVNPTSKFRLHHGNQQPSSFACMVSPTSEPHQKWNFQGASIISQLDGKALCAEGASAGTQVVMRNPQQDKDEEWILVPITPIFRIIHKHSGLALMINHSGPARTIKDGSSTNLTINKPNSSWQQQWEIDPKNQKIINCESRKCIHHGNQSRESAFPCMVGSTSEQHQIWKFVQNKIISALDGKGLTVNSPSPGSKVVMEHFNVHQAPPFANWSFERISY